jgi:hypothetical protein
MEYLNTVKGQALKDLDKSYNIKGIYKMKVNEIRTAIYEHE